MGGDKENLARGYPGNAKYSGVLVAIVTGGMALLASSFWEFCPSEDLTRRWHSCLDHGHPHSARYTGEPVAIGIGDTVLGFFLASGSSAPLKTECGVVLLLGLQDGLWWHQVCRYAGRLRCRRYGTIRAFF